LFGLCRSLLLKFLVGLVESSSDSCDDEEGNRDFQPGYNPLLHPLTR
jgi:hypothetical protein